VIEQLWTQGGQGIEGWREAPLGDLVIHIIEQFHMPARVEMARMETLAEEAVLLEGTAHPGVLAVREEVGRFCREFRAHMAMEERSVFRRVF
jgi:iron-sulfur cluster repair protein YtfE (RIC family)